MASPIRNVTLVVAICLGLSCLGHAPGIGASGALERGMTAAQKADWPTAIKFFVQAHEQNPEQPAPIFNLGLAYDQMGGKPMQAVSWFQAYLAIAPQAHDRDAVARRVRELTSQIHSISGRVLRAAVEAARNAPERARDWDLLDVAFAQARYGLLQEAYATSRMLNDERAQSSVRALIGMNLAARGLPSSARSILPFHIHLMEQHPNARLGGAQLKQIVEQAFAKRGDFSVPGLFEPPILPSWLMGTAIENKSAELIHFVVKQTREHSKNKLSSLEEAVMAAGAAVADHWVNNIDGREKNAAAAIEHADAFLQGQDTDGLQFKKPIEVLLHALSLIGEEKQALRIYTAVLNNAVIKCYQPLSMIASLTPKYVGQLASLNMAAHAEEVIDTFVRISRKASTSGEAECRADEAAARRSLIVGLAKGGQKHLALAQFHSLKAQGRLGLPHEQLELEADLLANAGDHRRAAYLLARATAAWLDHEPDNCLAGIDDCLQEMEGKSWPWISRVALRIAAAGERGKLLTKLFNKKHFAASQNTGIISGKTAEDRKRYDLTAGLELLPNVPNLYYARAEAFYRRDDWPRAIADYEDGIRVSGQKPAPHRQYALAFALFANGDFEAAAGAFDSLVTPYGQGEARYTQWGLVMGHIARLRAGSNPTIPLKPYVTTPPSKDFTWTFRWPGPIIELLAGMKTHTQLLAGFKKGYSKYSGALFFKGQQALIEGDLGMAEDFFRQCIYASRKTWPMTSKLAAIELKRMGKWDSGLEQERVRSKAL